MLYMKDNQLSVPELNSISLLGTEEKIIVLANAYDYREDQHSRLNIEQGSILFYAHNDSLEVYDGVIKRCGILPGEVNDKISRFKTYQKSLELGAEPNEDFLNNSSEAYIRNFNKLPEDKQKEIIEGATREEVERRVLKETADLRKQAKAEKEAKEKAQREINDLKEQNEKLQKDLKDKPKKVYPTDYSQAKEKAQQYDRVKAELQELKDKIKSGEIGREDKEKAEERIKELELKIFNLEGIHNTMNKWGLTKDGMENMDDACETVLTYHRKLTKFFDEEVPLNTLNRVASYMVPGMPITVDFISFLDNIIYWAETAKKAIPKSDNTDEPVKYEDCNYVEVKVMEVE